ncbi:SigE family RNA polymerase sigma factor [Kribbella sp. NPDC056861]|uniref:SigE family RNA polymerase sigma factor n=1 Tax=Kribbella sp. NPDC056861 TaxID=3154857 RepID=UPI003433D9EC
MSGPADFERFASTQYTALLRTAYLLTQNRASAEDLVQATLAKCWLVWKRIEADDPMPYVRRTMVNTYTSWWRRRWNGEYPTEQLPEVTDPGAQSGVETSTDLSEALRRLPKRMRAVIVLRFYEDLTEAETARLLNCSVGTVKSQTSRALAKLRIDPRLFDHSPAKEGRA